MPDSPGRSKIKVLVLDTVLPVKEKGGKMFIRRLIVKFNGPIGKVGIFQHHVTTRGDLQDRPRGSIRKLRNTRLKVPGLRLQGHYLPGHFRLPHHRKTQEKYTTKEKYFFHIICFPANSKKAP